MLRPTEHLIALELSTLEPPDDTDLSDIPTITVFQDEHNNFFLASGLKDIEIVILSMIFYCGKRTLSSQESINFSSSSYLYSPFRLQILPGTETDAFLYKTRHESSTRNQL